MSNYNKVIIFIVFLIVFSGALIYLHNTESSMNKNMPDISDNIATGDSDYNAAVDSLNNKNYNEATNKAISANNNFNQSLILLLGIKDNFTSGTNDIHKKYINSVISELELKMNNKALVVIDIQNDITKHIIKTIKTVRVMNIQAMLMN